MSDLQTASFQSAKQLLSVRTIGAFAREDDATKSRRRPSKLITLPPDAKVADALQVLSDSRILSAPVLSADSGEFQGFIDVHDLLRGLIRNTYPELLDAEYVGEHQSLSLMELQTIGPDFVKQPITKFMHDGDLWYRHDANCTLLEICKEGFRLQVPTAVHAPRQHLRVQHRVGVFDILPGQDTPDGSIPRWQITNVLSQSDVMRHLTSEITHLDTYFSASLQELGLLSNKPLTVPGSQPAISVLALLYRRHKGGTAIVDDAGRLIGNLSVSDVRGLRADRFGALCLPVAEFVSVATQQDSAVWDDVLFGKHSEAVERGDWAQVLQNQNVVSVSPSASLEDAMKAMCAAEVHRCYVVDGEGKPVAVVTVTDVLRRIVN